MSSDETIKGLIEKSRHDLSRAVDALEATPRPANVCGSHDAIFSVHRASASALDTILAVLADKVGAVPAVVDDGIKLSWSWVVKAYGRTLIWASAAIVITALIFGRMEELGRVIERFTGHAQVIQYDPAG